MKFQKYLLLSVMSLLLLSSVSAVVTYAEFNDLTKSATINFGDTINFQVDFLTMNAPMQVKVELFNSSDNVVYTFIDTTINGKEYKGNYNLTKEIYLSNGNFKIGVSASDKLSSVYDELSVKINPVITPINDTTKPTIEILGPVANNTYSTQVKFLNFIATDAHLSKCEYSKDNGVTKTVVACTSGVLTTVSLSSVEGANRWIVYAEDSSGNKNTEEVSFSVNSSLTDTTAPTIRIISPEKNKEYSKEKITFKVTTDEDAKVYFSLDGDDKIKMSNPYDHVFTYTLDLSDKEHTVTFYATDTAGNTAKKSVDFSNDYTLEDATSPNSRVNNLTGISGTGSWESYVTGEEPSIIYLTQTKTKISCWQKFCNFWKAIWAWIVNFFKTLFEVKN